MFLCRSGSGPRILLTENCKIYSRMKSCFLMTFQLKESIQPTREHPFLPSWMDPDPAHRNHRNQCGSLRIRIQFHHAGISRQKSNLDFGFVPDSVFRQKSFLPRQNFEGGQNTFRNSKLLYVTPYFCASVQSAMWFRIWLQSGLRVPVLWIRDVYPGSRTTDPIFSSRIQG